jgi:hypothetical protein
MKQLYANNAKTTLANPLAVGDTALVVADGSKFPSPSSYEYFLCTVELGGVLEIIMVTGRIGNTFTIGGFLESGETVPGRGQEASAAKAFSAGARVEGRVTKGALDRTSKNLTPLASIDLIVAPKDSYNEGYIVGTLDAYGNPILAVAKDIYTWRFLNYTTRFSKTSTAVSTTTITCASLVVSDVAAGKYLIQFTSGVHAGKVRTVSSVVANVTTWSGALSPAPTIGDTFEILKATASIIDDALSNLTFPISDNFGTTNAIAGTYGSGITTLTDNLTLMVVLTAGNTITSPTFSPNSLTAKVVKQNDGTALAIGQLTGTVTLRYEVSTDNWRLVESQATNGTSALSFFLGNL